MIRNTVWCVTVLLCSLSLGMEGDAREIKLPILRIEDDVYSNVTITSFSATDIYFTHSRGIGNAKLKNLDLSLQREFNFDPVKSSISEQQQAESFGRYRTAIEANESAKVSWSDFVPCRTNVACSTNVTNEVFFGGEVLDQLRKGFKSGPIPARRPKPVPAESPARTFLGEPCPTFSGRFLTSVPNPKDKFLLFDFWNSTCDPCRTSIPALSALQNTFKGRLVIIGVSDEPEDVIRRAAGPVVDYALVTDALHDYANQFGLKRIPYAVLVDQLGIVRFEGHPALLTEQKVENLLARYSQ